ncbi:hypothetical protein KVT40_007724 [Elsinoe batatas]|uniref:Uncharacterized protein n=1 Tax=Elsinoe batatas TaxID=2601811 RepID=A0A8K0KW67_9PEZI|nr:hypothetical protein KVT40_007724 [Elsinoe batatas]
MHRSSIPILALAAMGSAQRPTNTSICDYYTAALFGENTGANQYALVSAVVNRAGTGNQTSTPKVNGIATPGTFNGQEINLGVYFTGALNSTNRGGSSGVSVNFLDGGGPDALLMGKAANSEQSNQFTLFTHLYQYFGSLLMCSQYGMEGYAAYNGAGSQYEVHKFMDLDENEVGYFNQQVGLSAASFGVTEEDVTAVGTALNSVFNVRCAPPTAVVPAQGAQLQSICIAESCPLSPNATCDSYMAQPKPVNATMANSNGTMTNGSMTGGSMTGGSATSSAIDRHVSSFERKIATAPAFRVDELAKHHRPACADLHHSAARQPIRRQSAPSPAAAIRDEMCPKRKGA